MNRRVYEHPWPHDTPLSSPAGHRTLALEPLHGLLAKHCGEVIARHGPDGRIEAISEAALAVLGRPPEAWLGEDLLAHAHPDDREVLSRALPSALWTAQPVLPQQGRLLRADGGVVWVELVAVALFEDPQTPERPTGWLTRSRDISDHMAARQALLVSEERLGMVLAHSNAGLFDVAYATLSGYFSAVCCELLQPVATRPALRVRSLLRQVHPSDRRGLVQAWLSLPAKEGWLTAEFRLRRPGAYRWMRVSGRLVDAGGTAATRVVGSLEDFTESQRSAQQLLETRAHLDHAYRLARVGTFSRSLVGSGAAVWSEQALRILGRASAPGEQSVPSLSDYVAAVHPEDRAAFQQRLFALMQRVGAEEMDTRVHSRDGSDRRQRHVRHQWRVLPGLDGTPELLLGTLQDITELKRSEMALRALSGHHEEALNLERKRIAADVHDELGQQLTAMKLQIDLLQARAGSDAAQMKTIEALRESLRSTMEVARHIAMNLRPPALDLGLKAALEWLAEDFSLRSELQCRVSGDDIGPILDEQMATGLFRVAQESLSNVARHAGARNVAIQLHCRGDRLVLIISDDGCGFDPLAVPVHGHYGLFGMRERVSRMGGQLRVSSSLGAGTELCADVPLQKARASAHRLEGLP